MALPLEQFSPGDLFAERYTIVEPIGVGGMGDVYKAKDRVLGRTVALKLLRPEVASQQAGVQRFEREIRVAQNVAHDNVCRMHDIGEHNRTRYISMEYVDGQTLAELIRSMGRLSPRQTIALARQLASGLEAIHKNGVIHRDLKPANIMIDRSGRAVLMDFGLAFAEGGEPITSAGEVLGTLSYLSPEQAKGEPADARSDIFALGLVLFEALTGKKPPGDGERMPFGLRAPGACPPPSRLTPEVPPALDAIVLRCLEHEPSKRFESARELAEAIGAVPSLDSSASHDGSVLPTAAAPASEPRPSVRGLLLALALALALIAVIALGVVLVLEREGAETTPDQTPPSLALLPVAFSGAEELQYVKHLVPLYLGDALRETHGLEVAPFASSRAFEPTGEPRSVAAELGVDYLLTGTLRVDDDGTVVSALELVSASGEVSWSGGAEGRLDAIQDSLAGVVTEIRDALDVRPEPSRLPRTRSAEALARYSEGVTYLEGWDVDANHERAARAFEEALAIEPDFVEAKAQLAMALWTSYLETREPDDVVEAERLASEAVREAPSLPEAHLAYGVVALGQGRSALAAESLAEAERLAPGNDDVCRRIGYAYERLGRDEEAEAMYRRAIELRPSYFRHVNELGAFYLHRGRLEEAKAQFREVIRLSPERHTGYTNLAGAHLLAGEIEQAEPLLEAAVRLHTSDSAHNNLGFVYYSSGRFEEAVSQYTRAVELAPRDASYRANLGDAYRQLGRVEAAREAYERAIELETADLALDPENREARVGLSMSLAGAGRCDRARAEAARATDGAPDDPMLQYYAAVSHAICGRDDAAIASATVAVRGGVVADVRTNPDLARILDREPLASLLR